MIRRIRSMMWKEFLELRQTPRLLVLLIVAPIVQLTMLGYAATTDIHHVPIVVVDGDRTPRSRALLERFSASRYFDVVKEELDPRAVEDDLAHGRAWLAIVIPPGFEASLDGGGAEADRTVQILADGTDANSSGVAMAYATSLIGEYNGAVAAERGVRAGTIDPRVRVWFNPSLESRYFMVPGVLAMLLLLITTNLSSMAIVRERELGTLEQLSVTPLRNIELILGKLLPYGLIGFLDVLLVVSVAVFWFGVPLRGSMGLLLASSCVYLLCTFGLGLFISTVSATQQQAMMTSVFFFIIPMMYLSGFIFPIENMPKPIQAVTVLIPLRYFLVIVRGIFLKGVGFNILWPQLAALAVWGVSVLTLAVWEKKMIRVGTSGYNYPEWRGTFYPEEFPANEMFAYYAARFGTVEINYTFYRMPTPKTTAAWRDQAPDGFRYALKAPRRITHDKRLKDCADSTQFFCDAARVLEDHLGPLLFQLPPNLKVDVPRLDAFLETVPRDLRSAVEFRHDSWHDEQVYAVLRKHGVALCIADFGDHATPLQATAPHGYFRLRDEGYQPDDLARWAASIQERAKEWDEVFVYFKHEEEGKGPEFAKAFISNLELRT